MCVHTVPLPGVEEFALAEAMQATLASDDLPRWQPDGSSFHDKIDRAITPPSVPGR